MDFVKFIDPNKNTNGSRARTDYEEIINLSGPTTCLTLCTGTNNNRNHSLIHPKRRRKRENIISEKFNKKQFFIATLSDDIEYLQKINFVRDDINTVDQFGWSALMMASCEGSINVVRFLLSQQVDLTICDRKGNTALTLADAKHHAEISNMIREKQSGKSCNRTTDNDDDVIIIENQTFDCSVCQRSFSDTTQKQHEASTVHLFNVKNKFQFSRRYHIPDSNVGFKMMLAQGWNRECGLGPKDREGKLYPVKTTLRKNRSGLGVKQDTAKITHFVAFDRDAVKRRPPAPKPKTKHDLEREERRNRQKEIAMRKALS